VVESRLFAVPCETGKTVGGGVVVVPDDEEPLLQAFNRRRKADADRR
jgi:hypothetical protein